MLTNLELASTSNKTLKLGDLDHKCLVLYFYPKDSTPGCTTEAQQFRDLYSDFLVHTLDMFYVVKVKDLSHVEAMDDAEESYWNPLSNLHPEEFGLGSIRQGVAKFLAKHKTKE